MPNGSYCEFNIFTNKFKAFLKCIIGGNNKMIEENYAPFILSNNFSSIIKICNANDKIESYL